MMIAVIHSRHMVVVRHDMSRGVVVDGQLPIVHLVVVKMEVSRLRNTNADSRWLLLQSTRVVAGVVLSVVAGIVLDVVRLRCSS